MRSDDIAIRVSGLGKRYLVPQKHEHDFSVAPTWSERLKEFFPGLMGAGERDYFWALRDVSFEVKRGEVVGIVGENGSGKSTLLKILTGVTPPTEGVAELRGRVGSLLEVGTGFHPDLTGRENIFFNGSLLGLSIAEIRSKLDAIIEFSGIGEFIDVPVKRYSSGMYVRLAYSVASLLNSEIMILDEVLAVGDAAFRSKSEQNIRSNAKDGRTVLVVSHNPRSIATICDRAIILYKGRVVFEGAAKDAMAEYLSESYKETAHWSGFERSSEGDGRAEAATEAAAGQTLQSDRVGEVTSKTAARPSQPLKARSFVDLTNAPRHKDPFLPPPTMVLRWLSVHGSDGERRAEFNTWEPVHIRIGYEGLASPKTTYFSIHINNSAQDRMATLYSTDCQDHVGESGAGVVECVIPALELGLGLYGITVDVGDYNRSTNYYLSRDSVNYATLIRVVDNGPIKGPMRTEFQGAVFPTRWSVLKCDASAD